MNRIILIEDVQEFAENFTTEAKSKSIEVAHKRSFDGLKEILPKYHTKYAAVILDIKCLLTEDQIKEDSRFIGSAMTFLDKNVPRFPRFILTGDEVEFKKFQSFYHEEKIFLKNPTDIAKLFVELNKCILNSDYLLTKRLNSEVFEMFETGLLNQASEPQLVKIIQEGLTETNPDNFKGILANVRGFQETIFKSINGRDGNVVPSNMFRPNGMVKFNDLMKHLNGYPDNNHRPIRRVYQNNTIFNLNSSLYWSCGEYIHDEPNRNYMISHYGVKSLVYNLLEIVIWSKQYL